ncbi:hypothetical protein [Gemmata massiliana]|nr:hypothetical protein [Gemmata massiliana]
MSAPEYLLAMLVGYLITIVIETTVLLALLSRRHSVRVRVFAGVWLTTCTYPVVWLVIPQVFVDAERWVLLLVAETFAPVAECAIFWLAFIRPSALAPQAGCTDAAPLIGTRSAARDFAAITLANLCSFGLGEVLIECGLFERFVTGIERRFL